MQKQEIDTNTLALEALANDFLDVAESGIEFRTFLVGTTLPTLVEAIDKLLREVDRRGLLSKSDKIGINHDVKPFDPINWIAQYL